MNSRNIASVLKILFWGIIAMIAGLLLFSFYKGNNPFETITPEQGPLSVLHEETITEEIISVNLSWNVGGVKVIVSKDDNIHLIERSYVAVSKSKWAITSTANKTLKISSGNKNSFFFLFWHTPATYLELQLPAKTYDTFKFSVISGKNELSDLSVNLLNVNSTSGNISVKNLRADTLKLNITSGNITLGNATIHTFDAVMTSGNMIYDGVVDQRLDLTMTSGQFNSDLRGTAPQSIDFQMTSGQAHFTLAAPADFQLSLSKTSGNFSADFDHSQNGNTYTYKNGRDDYRLKMTSGSLTFSLQD